MIAVKNSNEVVENISVWTEGNTVSISSEEASPGRWHFN